MKIRRFLGKNNFLRVLRWLRSYKSSQEWLCLCHSSLFDLVWLALRGSCSSLIVSALSWGKRLAEPNGKYLLTCYCSIYGLWKRNQPVETIYLATFLVGVAFLILVILTFSDIIELLPPVASGTVSPQHSTRERKCLPCS